MVSFRDVLVAVGEGYSTLDGGRGQIALDGARKDLDPSVFPLGWIVKTSHQITRFTLTPWIGFLDPAETADPKEGLYVCWIFEPDLAHVILSIQQGTERLRGRVLDQLRDDALVLRDALGLDAEGRTEPISFGPGGRQRKYAVGSVIHQRFSLESLPSESDLIAANYLFCECLVRLEALRDEIARTRESSLHQGAPKSSLPKDRALLEYFKPKSADDYLVRMRAVDAVRTRSHEHLVQAYAGWAKDNLGLRPSTPHPIDLRLRPHDAANEDSWDNAFLVEAKVVRSGKVVPAVREVIGQLVTYPLFVVPEAQRSAVRCVGLFNECVGRLLTTTLEEDLGFPVVWWNGSGWVGGKRAVALGLARVVGDLDG